MLNISRDQLTFDLCRLDMEAYQRGVRHYLSCLQDEHADAIRRLDAIIERFNQCARHTVC